MQINSQYAAQPCQPDSPDDGTRRALAKYALTRVGWPEDYDQILALMSPPPDILSIAGPGQCKDVRVGVIGAGLAGLAAAYELRRAGFAVTLFEALPDRVGGRVYTRYFDKSRGLYGEFGPMRIPVIHETVWHYLNLFGLPTRPFIQYNPNALIYIKDTRVRNERDGGSVMREIYPKFALEQWETQQNWQSLYYLGVNSHLLTATPQDRAQIIDVLPQYSERAIRWSDSSGLEMMQAGGLSQPAIDLVTNFQPLLRGALYDSYIDYVEETYPGNMEFLYEIPGGFARLPQAFLHALCAPAPDPGLDAQSVGKVTLKRGCCVDTVEKDGAGGVTLGYRRQGAKRVCDTFDYVVCAVPFSTLRLMTIDPLFSGLKMRAIREVSYIPAQKSLFCCRERFWERQGIFGGGSYTDLPLMSLWYPSDHTQRLESPADVTRLAREPGVFTASYNFNLDTTRLTGAPDKDILVEIKRQLAAVHGLSPGALDRMVQGFSFINWDTQPTFRGALCFFSEEQKRLFSYAMTLPEYDGRVFFAGEHISAVHRWMQGALQTGMRAANDVALAARGRS